MRRPAAAAPVLLLGAGSGEATCGILYLAGYLRRNGVEAFVRLHDGDEGDDELKRSLTAMLKYLKPRIVGVSLKWFNHLSRGLHVAALLRAIDPEVRIVFGGDSASYFWKELAAYDCVDDIVIGDGEAPFLALCRGDATPPNVVSRRPRGKPSRAPLTYVQGNTTSDVFYSHFDDVFLSQLDQQSFSGWVAPGKGCAENCVYCAGGRGMQQAAFGRPTSFLRPAKSVHADHQEIAARTWQLRYDFSGGTADFLNASWAGLDLSKHATTYFLWGVPPRSLIDALAATFGRVYLVLDIGCFSSLQRMELMRRGLLKPCPTDKELLATIEACRSHPNLKLEVCGIEGLPFTSERALKQERALVEKVLALGCDVGAQRLEAQPGALVTQHPDRFDMVSDAQSFTQFVDWFAARGHATAGDFPMIRFRDPTVEDMVQRAAESLHELMQRAHSTQAPAIDASTKLVTSVAARRTASLGDWLGRHRVPARLVNEPVTVLRAPDGAGLACTPQLHHETFVDPNLQQGPTGAAILAALEVFGQPTTRSAAVAMLKKRAQLDAGSARELVDALAAQRFISPA